MLLENGFCNDCTVEVEDGMIRQIMPGKQADWHADVLTPGLIDLHCHGGEGFNPEHADEESLSRFLRKMQSSGVTDFWLTTSTSPRDVIRRALAAARNAMARQKAGTLGGARIQGVHLEGPFLSSARPGAMLKGAILPPDIAAYQDIFGDYGDVIREITLAPEEAGAAELIGYLKTLGVKVQAGHTYATYEQAMAGFDAGVESLCHSFNACRPIHHRDPGVVVAAMERKEVYMEAICDFLHLHPAIVKLIYREKGPDRMIVISDSVFSHGFPDGQYDMHGYQFVVKDGVNRTLEGALDGGVAYLDQSVRNLISIGIPPEDAVAMASRTPAARAGMTGLGAIAPGKRAHLTAWDSGWHPVFTVVEDEVTPC
ncbi:MAG: N-acetylglucosamine-6-phosphate deacetylase [Clostridiales bacterium]|nr:N-acetylglucosamine-6-phosphate deacetylase [Clostridiales bacterium]